MNDPARRKGAHGATVLMLLTNAYDPDPRVRQEARTLLDMGCRVRLLAWDRDGKAPASEIMEGIEVERVFLASRHGRGTTQLFFYAAVYLTLLWKGLRTGFDVVHCHDLDTLPVGFLLGKLKRKPVVYDAHESFTDMLDGSVALWVRRGLTWLEDRLIRRIDLLITVGEKLRRHFAGRGSPHSVVVGNWKHLHEYARTWSENREVRARLGIPEGALAVVCITQLLKDRKIEELLDAADRCPDVHVILGGKGILETFVRERAAKNPRIHYTGFVRGGEIASYTCAADIVYYGFDPDNPNARFSAPNKLFEALAAGRPLIAGDFGEIGAVIRETGCGIILAAYSADSVYKALSLMRDETTRMKMAESAKRAGRMSMNWARGEETLYREYSALIPAAALRQSPAAVRAAAGV